MPRLAGEGGFEPAVPFLVGAWTSICLADISVAARRADALPYDV